MGKGAAVQYSRQSTEHKSGKSHAEPLFKSGNHWFVRFFFCVKVAATIAINDTTIANNIKLDPFYLCVCDMATMEMIYLSTILIDCTRTKGRDTPIDGNWM